MQTASRSRLLGRAPRLTVAALVVAACLTGFGASVQAGVSPAAWSGRYDLYQDGVFSAQKTNTWCVAASVQMMLNIIQGEHDHSRTRQERYIRYARKHDRFQNPQITGTDVQGWVADMHHFAGLDNFHIVAAKTYTGAVRSAVRRLRATGEPVGLVIDHHVHAWVMTGFQSPTDPAVDPDFSVTAVYVMGPLYPNGGDPAPDARISYQKLKTYLNKYIDPIKPKNPWEGTFLTVQP